MAEMLRRPGPQIDRPRPGQDHALGHDENVVAHHRHAA
jgi:hypothetical protein